MIHFKELKYSRDNKNLIIDAAIDNLDYYKDMIIDSIIIDNQDTYINNGPSSNPIYTYQVTDSYSKIYSLPEQCNCNPVKTEDDSYCFVLDNNSKKHVRLEIPLNTLGIDSNKDILFVYVIASGTPAIDTPCGFDNNKIMGTVINLQNIYRSALTSLREIECSDNCTIPKYFIDFILRYKALELCIRTGNYVQAIKYWKKFFSNIKVKEPIKCKCNGNN